MEFIFKLKEWVALKRAFVGLFKVIKRVYFLAAFSVFLGSRTAWMLGSTPP